MDTKTLGICTLTVTAAILGVTLLTAKPAPAQSAGVVVRDRDWSVITARVQSGGDALYILDNRRGMLAIFTYDNTSRTMVPKKVEPVANAFRGR